MYIFGDSFTEGQVAEGNESYVAHLRALGHDINASGIGGTTFGEYSLYPVAGNSLMSRLSSPRFAPYIKHAETIGIEFGINDIVSAFVGACSMAQVYCTIASAIDLIRQLNPKAKIVFFRLSSDIIMLDNYFEGHRTYLRRYLKGLFPKTQFQEHDMASLYLSLFEPLSYFENVEVVDMVAPEQGEIFLSNLADDGIHPNDCMYGLIAKNIEVSALKPATKNEANDLFFKE